MSEPHPPRWLPSLLAVLLGATMVAALRPADDYDLFLHLAVGRWIAAHDAVPRADVFSSTHRGRPWIAHEWGSEWLFYRLERWGGFGTLSLLVALLAAAAAGLQFHLLRRSGLSSLTALGFWLLGVVVSLPGWVARPHLFTIVLVSLYLVLLEATRAGRWAAAVPLPFLMLAWANLHGGYLLGLALVGTYMLLGFARDRWPIRRGTLLATCLLAALITPFGPRHLLYAIGYLPGSVHTRFIQEWRRPDLASDLPLVLLLLLLGWSILRGGSSIARPVLLVALVLAFMTLTSTRYRYVLAPVALLAIAQARHGWGGRPRSRWSRFALGINRTLAQFGGRPRLAIEAKLVVLVIITPLMWLRLDALRGPVSPAKLPHAAVASLRADPPTGRLLNVYEWGGLVMWAGAPVLSPFVDGRADLYGDFLIDEYRPLAHPRAGDWDQRARRWQIDAVLCPAESDLARYLLRRPGWVKSFHEPAGLVFRRLGS